MKNILICTSENPLYNLMLRDIGDALADHNLNVTYTSFHREKHKYRDEYFWFNDCANRVYEANPDFVIFSGIEGVITLEDILPSKHLWDVLCIPFISINFGSPVKTLYRALEIGESKLCIAGINERSYIDNLRSFGFSNLFYFPMAVNPDRFAPGKGTYPEEFSKDADVAFIGNLKNENRLTWNRFNIASLRIPWIVEEIRKSKKQPADRVIQKYIEEMVDNDELTRADFSPSVSAELYSFCTREADFQKRKHVIQNLGDFTVNAGGNGWEDLKTDRLFCKDRVDYEHELPAVYADTPITVGISSYEGVTSIPSNVFDCFAAGGFMLSDKREDTSNFYREGEEIDCFSTTTELNEKVALYLKEENRRKDMAARAREKTLKEHTWERRVIKIIEEMERFSGEHKPVSYISSGIKSPLVSAVIIARNEGRFIGKCIKSLKKEVDEIIVVDTGSIDATPEIARGSGARLYFLNWEHNFSYARNFAISRATGQWVLIVDADEVLVPPAGSSSLREILENTEEDIYGYYVTVKGEQKRSRTQQVKLFRNGRGIMYEGAVNEWLSLDDEDKIAECPLVIENRRVAGSEDGNKTIASFISTGLGTLHMIFTMMELVNREGRYSDVKHYGEMFLDQVGNSSLTHSRYRRAYSMLANVYLLEGEINSALDIAYTVLNTNPQDLEMWFIIGKIYSMQENYPRLYIAYRNFMAVPSSNSHPRRTEFERLLSILPPKRKDLFDSYDFQAPPEITVCVLFRKDFDGYESIIQNVLPFADEVILGNATTLADTDVPEFPGEKIRIHDMPDAYSIGKSWNELRELSRKEWVFFLEPDEYVDPDSVLMFRDLIGLELKDERTGIRVVCDRFSKNGVAYREAELRIVNREKGPLYEGDAYCLPDTDDHVCYADIKVNNTVRSLNLQKFFEDGRERQQLLEYERGIINDNSLLFYQLARVYDDLQNYQLAVVNAQKGLTYCLEEKEENAYRLKYLYGLIIRGLNSLDCFEEAGTYAQELARRFPDFLDAHFYRIQSGVFQKKYDEEMNSAVAAYSEIREKLMKGTYDEEAPLYGLFQDGGVKIIRGSLDILAGADTVELIREGLEETNGELPAFVKQFLQDNTETILDFPGVKESLEEYTDSVDCLFVLIHLASEKEDVQQKLRYLEDLSDVSSFYRGDASYYKAELLYEQGQRQLAIAHYVTAVNEYQRILNEGYRVPQEMLIRYAESLERTGRVTAAITIYEVLLKVVSKTDAELIRIKIKQLKSIIEDT